MVLLFGCVVAGGHRGAFVVLGSQASPIPLWLVSVWSWLTMVGKLFEQLFVNDRSLREVHYLTQ